MAPKGALERLLEEIREEMRATAGYTGRSALSQRVLDALAAVDRAAFVGPGNDDAAFGNYPLPIGFGQTISQPYIVALMSELLDLQPGHRVLEIGTGSGYQAAVLSRLAGEVYSVEVIPELAERARRRLADLGFDNIHVRTGDGYAGWPEAAPFDAVMVTAACARIPPPLLEQLRPGGRLLLPLRDGMFREQLVAVDKDARGEAAQTPILPVAFVPLTGAGAAGGRAGS